MEETEAEYRCVGGGGGEEGRIKKEGRRRRLNKERIEEG